MHVPTCAEECMLGTCTLVCMHIWRPEVNIQCLPQSLAMLFLRQSYTEHGAQWLDYPKRPRYLPFQHLN